MKSIILPAADPSFAWRDRDAGPALVCTALEPVASHFFTTRPWSLGSPHLREDARAWQEIADGFAGDPVRLVRLHQVHGAHAVVADPELAPQDADIVLTDDPSLVVVVQAADCVPMLLADRNSGAVAAAHAGWRGLAAGVPRAAVEAMARTFGTDAGDLIVAMGPSIGACCYEVGVDVRRAFEASGVEHRNLDRWFVPAPRVTTNNPSLPGLSEIRRPGHEFFDGWQSARDQLIAANVNPAQIFSAELCTASHPAVCCSYRRDGSRAGRLAGAIRSRRRP